MDELSLTQGKFSLFDGYVDFDLRLSSIKIKDKKIGKHICFSNGNLKFNFIHKNLRLWPCFVR